MNTVIVILLIWLIVFLHFVWLDIKPWELMRDRKIQKQPQVRSPETEIGKGLDFIGRSHVKIIVKETNAANIAPKAPRTEEGEDVDAKDVTFASPKQEKMLRQMTPEEEEEAFRNFSYSKDEHFDEDEYPADGYAEGLTSEEMERAVSVANGTKATREEEQKACQVLREMDGTELLDLLTRNNQAFKSRVRDLLDRCEMMEADAKDESPSSTVKGHESIMTEKSTDIDIRDYI